MIPAQHAVPSASAAFSQVALQEDSCPVFKLRHSVDTTRLPDVPPPKAHHPLRFFTLLHGLFSFNHQLRGSFVRMSVHLSTCPTKHGLHQGRDCGWMSAGKEVVDAGSTSRPSQALPSSRPTALVDGVLEV